jgi:hypothetical protein
MPKHTPGPWAITEKRLTNGATLNVWSPPDQDGYRYVVARVDAGVEPGEGDANAHLIAAAPDLLAALKSAVAEIEAWRSGKNNRNMNKCKVGAIFADLHHEGQIRTALREADAGA